MCSWQTDCTGLEFAYALLCQELHPVEALIDRTVVCVQVSVPETSRHLVVRLKNPRRDW